MSRESIKDSNSHSESSGSSPGQTPFFQEHFFSRDSNSDITDLTLFGNPAPTFVRTGTVRRVPSTSLKKEKELLTNAVSVEDNENNVVAKTQDQVVNNRYRKSLDSTFRHSLDSISEHRTRRSFSPISLVTSSRDCSSLDSSSSEHTDALRSLTDNAAEEKDKTIQSPNSSYLTWIESVNSEYFGSAVSTTAMENADNKVGEWNNFWLNYNNARGGYLSSSYLNGDEKFVDDASEAKSTCSTHRELTGKNSGEYINLTLDEIQEAVKCAQRITDILQNALRRNYQDTENVNMENSYYSEPFSRQNSFVKEDYGELPREEVRRASSRERSMSYAVTSAELQKQKELLKPAVQSSSTSCINALLNTGVADILKRVISKRRDVMSPESVPSLTRSSFSEWSGK